LPRCLEPAFVLRKWDVGESDQVVSLLTRGRGRVKGVARGAKNSKKRFGGLLSPFLLINVEYFENRSRDLVRIENSALLHYFSGIREDLRKLVIGCGLIEITERALPEGDDGEAFFDLLLEGFTWLEEQQDAGPLLAVFVLKVLALIGIQPQVGSCVHCRRRLGPTGVFGFSVPQGGVVCGSCVQRGTVTHQISSRSLSLFPTWLSSPLAASGFRDFPRQAAQEAERVLSAFLSYHMGRELRSLHVFRKLFAEAGS